MELTIDMSVMLFCPYQSISCKTKLDPSHISRLYCRSWILKSSWFGCSRGGDELIHGSLNIVQWFSQFWHHRRYATLFPPQTIYPQRDRIACTFSSRSSLLFAVISCSELQNLALRLATFDEKCHQSSKKVRWVRVRDHPKTYYSKTRLKLAVFFNDFMMFYHLGPQMRKFIDLGLVSDEVVQNPRASSGDLHLSQGWIIWKTAGGRIH